MSVDKFELVLENAIYYGGQNITGAVVIVLRKPTKIKEIRVIYHGSGSVQWTLYRVVYMTTYVGKETYFGLSVPMFGGESEPTELDVGRHVFHFELPLPVNMPCSFQSSNGRIEYTVEARLFRPWRFQLTRKQTITYNSICDLNIDSSKLALPISLEGTKTFWRSSGDLFLSADIPVSGFVCGQIIPIKVSVNNKTQVPVKSIVATLSQVVDHRVKRHLRTKHANVVVKKVPLNDGFGFRSIHFNIEVPALPPSDTTTLSQLMDLKYLLTIEAEVGLFRFNHRLSTEIVIGNIPLMVYQKPISSRQEINSDDSENVVTSPELASYGDFAPPVFENLKVNQSCFMRPPSDVLYPVYTFENRPTYT